MCVLCNFVRSILPHVAELPTEATKRIKEWVPTSLNLVPTVWRLRADDSGKYTQFYFDEKGEQEALLKLEMGKSSNDDLLEDILELHEKDPYLSSVEDGTWIRLSKKKYSYKLTPTEDKAIINNMEDILKKYPNLVGFGKDNKKDNASVISLIEASWAYEQVVKHIGEVDFSSVSEDA